MPRTASSFLILIFVFLGFALSLQAGAAHVSFTDYWQWLMHSLNPQNYPELSSQTATIISEIRLPRTLAAALVGFALGASGLTLQTVLRNPLGEPYTLGLSGGGALGAVVALALELQPWTFWVPAGSVLGCCAAAALVLGFSSRSFGHQSRSLILFGMMISLFFGAAVVTLLSVLNPEKLQQAMNWLLGEFGTTRDQWSYHLWPMILGLFFLLIAFAKHLDHLSLGSSRSLSLGTSPKLYRGFFIIITTFITAMAVSIAGLIGFIGLVSPHIARFLIRTSRHKTLLMASSAIGSGLLLISDSLGRLINTNSEIPAGSISALIGAPILIYFLLRPGHAQAD
jgi:iron complex transport system permease protein